MLTTKHCPIFRSRILTNRGKGKILALLTNRTAWMNADENLKGHGAVARAVTSKMGNNSQTEKSVLHSLFTNHSDSNRNHF